MSLSEAIEATPHAALEDAATEMASAITVVAAAFREVGLVTDPETIFPFVDLLLSRADAASFDEKMARKMPTSWSSAPEQPIHTPCGHGKGN